MILAGSAELGGAAGAKAGQKKCLRDSGIMPAKAGHVPPKSGCLVTLIKGLLLHCHSLRRSKVPTIGQNPFSTFSVANFILLP